LNQNYTSLYKSFGKLIILGYKVGLPMMSYGILPPQIEFYNPSLIEINLSILASD